VPDDRRRIGCFAATGNHFPPRLLPQSILISLKYCKNSEFTSGATAIRTVALADFEILGGMAAAEEGAHLDIWKRFQMTMPLMRGAERAAPARRNVYLLPQEAAVAFVL
jgi:hypothetical protein